MSFSFALPSFRRSISESFACRAFCTSDFSFSSCSANSALTFISSISFSNLPVKTCIFISFFCILSSNSSLGSLRLLILSSLLSNCLSKSAFLHFTSSTSFSMLSNFTSSALPSFSRPSKIIWCFCNWSLSSPIIFFWVSVCSSWICKCCPNDSFLFTRSSTSVFFSCTFFSFCVISSLSLSVFASFSCSSFCSCSFSFVRRFNSVSVCSSAPSIRLLSASMLCTSSFLFCNSVSSSSLSFIVHSNVSSTSAFSVLRFWISSFL